jgi:hypothetical protein
METASMAVFWVVMPSGLVEGYKRFGKNNASIFRDSLQFLCYKNCVFKNLATLHETDTSLINNHYLRK